MQEDKRSDLIGFLLGSLRYDQEGQLTSSVSDHPENEAKGTQDGHNVEQDHTKGESQSAAMDIAEPERSAVGKDEGKKLTVAERTEEAANDSSGATRGTVSSASPTKVAKPTASAGTDAEQDYEDDDEDFEDDFEDEEEQ